MSSRTKPPPGWTTCGVNWGGYRCGGDDPEVAYMPYDEFVCAPEVDMSPIHDTEEAAIAAAWRAQAQLMRDTAEAWYEHAGANDGLLTCKDAWWWLLDRADELDGGNAK